MKNELERIRDQLKCSLNMGGLKGSAEWAVGELDRLIASAPTVKAEQARYSIEDLQKEALNAGLQYVREPDDHYVTGTTEQALGFIRNMIGVDIRLTDAAPSLPAAGSAVEEVEPIGYAWINRYNQAVDHVAPFPPTDGGVSYGERLMTVAQHERMGGGLSAQQSAPEHSLDQSGKLLVSAEPLRQVLNALVNAPHMIRELQATREPVALFADNPINVLIAEFNAAHGGE